MELIQNIPLSVKFLTEKKRGKDSNDDYLLYARILYNRDKVLISTKIAFKIQDWDSTKGQFCPTKNINAVRNNKMREITDRITQIYFNLKANGIPISAKSIKSAYDGKTATYKEMEFLRYYKQYIEEIKLKPNEYGQGVINSYNKAKTHLENFLKLKGWQNIKMSELSRKFLEAFENYLLSTPNTKTEKIMCNNTSTTYIRKIKASVNAAVRKEILPNNPFISFKMKPFKTPNRVFLTTQEIELLRTHNLGENPALKRVRDTFIFCCATGLRHSDAVQLHERMIKKDNEDIYWISLFQQKTKDYIEIPMTDMAVEIYNRFEPHRKSTGLVLPMLTNQKVNTALKII